ncbi:C-type lectin domain family 2 member B-like isoform X2 [Epinephelus fuscoguttatus]|uniref:C-type lectin domain family 2 member B-like isoform X2 n=1 Tax=Epinephelus fuscoguttatus TaxID=293821 RepID=UPI0020D03212|nr:C-type lectin domain family 2 member B-like isoform X2 [Epinephelus fuscoguttatus]
MSLDIYATPDLSKKVRYNREVQEDKVEWEERQVDIYESTDAIGNNHTDIQSLEGGPHTEKHPPAVQRRPFRVAAYCLGVLCLVMMTGIILLSVLWKWCPDGWSKFGCSCYFKMNEEKNWDRSRADCRQRGADLVVINNKEEQKFVTELNVHGESWIGLQETWTGGRWEWEQKWVDGSPLTEMFWAPGLPTHEGYQHAATCCNDQGQWTQSLHHVYKNWICEK